MNTFTVLFYEDSEETADPDFTLNVSAFECEAEDLLHANEQCENAYPGCLVVFTGFGDYDEVWNDFMTL